MTSTALDSLITEVVDDDVARAANDLIARLEITFRQDVEKALSLQHSIPADPVAAGLKDFNSRLASLNTDSTWVNSLLSRLIFEKRTAQDRVKKAKAAYEERFTLLLNHDDSVRNADGGQKGREHAARDLMQRETRLVSYCERIYTIVLGYYESVKLVQDSLKETKGDSMKQLAVIKQQVALGEVDPSRFPLASRTPHISPAEETRMQVEAEIASIVPGGEGTIEF